MNRCEEQVEGLVGGAGGRGVIWHETCRISTKKMRIHPLNG